MMNLVLLLALFSFSSASCPPPEVVSPCTCKSTGHSNGGMLTCREKNLDLKATLKKISANRNASAKHFNLLQIASPDLTEIGPEVTGDLTFDSISIIATKSLKRIHSDAFKNAKLIELSVGETAGQLESQAKPYNSFDLINSLVDATDVSFNAPKVNVIPPEAFTSKKLKYLNFGSSLRSTTTRLTISDRAFYHLDHLDYLELPQKRINYLPPKAFEFKNNATSNLVKYFWINLFDNQLNSTSFANGWLANVNRQWVSLHLGKNPIDYLDKAVFKTFLDKSPKNSLRLYRTPINCTDCRNVWLLRDAQRSRYEHQLTDAHCGGDYDHGEVIFETKKLDKCPN